MYVGFLYLCIHVEPISTINVVHRQTDTYMQRERERKQERESQRARWRDKVRDRDTADIQR